MDEGLNKLAGLEDDFELLKKELESVIPQLPPAHKDIANGWAQIHLFESSWAYFKARL